MNSFDVTALLLSLRLAAVTTVLLLAISTPLAAWIVFGKSRGRALMEAASTLPLLLPPTVLGFYLLVLLGPRTALGRLFATLTGHPAAFSFTGLVIGSIIYSFPFTLQPIVAGFSSVPVSLIEAARLLGASRKRILWELVLPLSKRSLGAAAALCFAHTMGEFGVVLMIGGDIPHETRTLSIAIFDQVQDFDYHGANHTALLLLSISFVALASLYATRKQKLVA